MIGICLPTRGMVFTRTVQCIADGIESLKRHGIDSLLFTTFDLPIPDGHNDCVKRALRYPEIDRILFVEEDMFFSPEAFVALCTTPEPMATLQYNDKNGRPHGIIEFDFTGEVVWCGLGATSVKREVFEKLDQPYFEIKRRWKNIRWNDNGVVKTRYERVSIDSIYQYGGLDVDFCHRVRELGFRIANLQEHKAHHFELVELGKPHTNQGCHTIRTV